MILIETSNGYLISGKKTFNDPNNKILNGKPNANCLVVVTSDDKTKEFARTVTNTFGEYAIEQPFDNGIYRITFYGTGDLDDFEQFTIKNSSSEFDNTPPDNTTGGKLSNYI